MHSVASVNSGKRTDAVVVEIKYRLSGKPKVLADLYGSNVAAFGLDTTLWDIQDCALKHFNLTWTKSGRSPVAVTETTLWQRDNGNIDQDLTGATLKEYVAHLAETGLSTAPAASTKFGKKTSAQQKRSAVSFELFIFENMYLERMENYNSVPASELGKGGGKRDRTGSMELSTGEKAPSKVQRVAGCGFEFHSLFSLSSRSTSAKSSSGPIDLSTHVVVQKIECMHLTVEGQPVFVQKVKVNALVADSFLAHGSMEAVFEITFPDSKSTTKYIVKRFFRLTTLSSNEDNNGAMPTPDMSSIPFTVDEHSAEICAKCVRLAQGSQFLKDFYKACQKKGIDVYKHLQFANLWLLQECRVVSKASGMGLTWLMEERHVSSHVTRFSGTLQHASVHSEISHLTIYAFAHFVLESTKHQIVCADLQATVDSGVGDHGIQGINSFLKQHRCGIICEGLCLTQPGESDLLDEDEYEVILSDTDGDIGNNNSEVAVESV
ncbi:hypothetical protein FA15DRAFT_710745 [Coprinopsis marcescibilis]|uniref:Alpha-type protein kinase domain-containing protein n=1 Tax=Coprinopsis marcescibilis TaxID=230819 RepID=A0A5C3KC40_COPMA|nr:hypothetical protein FA15DRAFT_710745 [Coprinopsis marcescibilis]